MKYRLWRMGNIETGFMAKIEKKIKFIYIGNRGSLFGKTPSVQDELTPLFSLKYNLISVSGIQNKFFRGLHIFFTLLAHTRSAKFILVDVYSTQNFYFAVLTGLMARLFNKPYICFLHGGNLPERLKNSPKLSNWLFKNASKIVAPSIFLAKSFRDYGFTVEVIPNMVNLKNYTFESQRDWKSIKLIWVRSFKKHYLPQNAIVLLKSLLDSQIPSELVMVGPDGGDGSFQHVQELISKYKLEPYVKLTGLLPKPDWLKLSKKSNIFVNTTSVDNTPISLIEAMALGLPVISTNVGGIPYLVENQKEALLVSPNNIEEMKMATIEIFKNSNLREDLINSGFEKSKKFDWEVLALKWEQLFASI
jgi:glycosyltransferase involved in cell wall biosynthesis